MTDKLPKEPNKAVQELIRLGLQVKSVLLEENASVAQNKPDDFKKALEHKEAILVSYEAAAKEFQDNISDYKAADENLMEQLKTLQKELSVLSKKSLDLLNAIKKR